MKVLQVDFLLLSFSETRSSKFFFCWLVLVVLKTEGLAYFYPTESLRKGSAEEAQRRLEGAIEARLEGLVLKDSHES